MKINILANFAGSMTLILFPALLFPFYLIILDAEKYGLFTFYFVILLYSKIFDFGITSTFNRYIARGEKPKFIYDLLKNIEIIFITLSSIIFLAVVVTNEFIINNWFETKSINNKNLFLSTLLITLSICIRFFISIYRGGLNGLEKQVLTNLLRVTFEFLSLFGGLFVAYFLSYLNNFNYTFDIYKLFVYFMLINLLELYFYRFKLMKNLNHLNTYWISFNFEPIKKIANFLSMAAIATLCWFSVNWFDRIIFSGILNLKYYGYYVTLSFLSSISLFLVVPINTAILPRIVRLYKLEAFDKINYYFQIIFVINFILIMSNVWIISLYSREILLVWTGNFELAEWGKDTLIFYNLGYSSAALINTFSIYFFATGKLKFISFVNTIWALITIFLFLIASIYYNVLQAGIFWFITNFFLLIIIGYKFYQFTRFQIQWKTIYSNFFKILFIASLLYIFNFLFKESLIFYNRLILFVLISILYFVFIFACLYSLDLFKKLIKFLQQVIYKS
tara:strand:+ start:27 stop:1544 length:1518 start_codon:yes stop_codon:yes gene_type:complete